MNNTQITYLVAGVAGVLGLAAFTAFFLVPVWSAYGRVWERIAATFLSLYVLAALLLAGIGVGGAVIYFWDRFQ